MTLVTRAYRGSPNGLSRYDRALLAALRDGNAPGDELAIEVTAPTLVPLPGQSLIKSLRGPDLRAFQSFYPFLPLRGSPDLFHLTHASHATLLWRLPTKPVVVTVHDLFHYVHRHDPRLSAYGHVAHRWSDALATRLLARATILLASSGQTRDDLLSLGTIRPEQVRVVALGIDRAAFRPAPPPDDFWARFDVSPDASIVLHVSSEEPRKNVETLLRAWRHVCTERPDAILVKGGASLYPRERLRLLALAHSLELGESLKFVDALSDADLASFYNAASVFAFPSIGEGFGFPVLEAMACGTPVVCSDIAALRELAGDAARYVSPRDEAHLAAEILTVLDDGRQRERMRASGLRRAERYSWQRTAAETRAAYRSALN